MNVMIESNDLRLRSKIITKPNIKIKKMKLSGNERFSLIIASNWATQKEVSCYELTNLFIETYRKIKISHWKLQLFGFSQIVEGFQY